MKDTTHTTLEYISLYLLISYHPIHINIFGRYRKSKNLNSINKQRHNYEKHAKVAKKYRKIVYQV